MVTFIGLCCLIFQGVFLNDAVANDRFTLQHTYHDQRGEFSTGVYFDNVKNRLVVKRLQWNKDFEKMRRNEKLPKFRFPETAQSINNFSSSALSENYGVGVSYDYLPIESQRDVAKAKSVLNKYFPGEQEDRFLSVMVGKVDRNPENKYELTQVGKNGKYDVAVYYNKIKGEFVLKGFKQKRKDPNKRYIFPPSLGNHLRANPRSGSNYKVDENEVYKARTPSEFAKALEEIKDELDDYSIQLPPGALDAQKQQMYNQLKDFVFVRSKNKREKSGSRYYNFTYEVYYNYKKHQVLYRKLNATKGNRIESEEIYDLGDEERFREAQRGLTRAGIFNNEEVDNFRDLVLPSCGSALANYLVPDVRKFENVTDILFEEYLKSALAKRPLISGDREMILEVNIFDRKRRVKAQLDHEGKIIGLNFLDNQSAKDLYIEKDGRTGAFVVKSKAVNGVEAGTPMMLFETENVFKENGGTKGQLSVYVRGKKSTGMFKNDDFEKSIYNFNFERGKPKLASVGQRVRVDGRSRNAFNLSASKSGAGGLMNVLFRGFISDSGAKKRVRDTVYEEASTALAASDTFRSYINDREIRVQADIVANQTERRTNNFSNSLNSTTAIASEEAYSRFSDLLLNKMLKDMLAGENPKDIQAIVNKVMQGFRKCLADGTRKRNPDHSKVCLEIFEREAPIEIGREIMKLKMKQAGVGDFNDFASRQYNKCIQEKYDPLYARGGEVNMDASLGAVKGCLFQTVLDTIQKAGPTTIDNELKLLSKDSDIEIKLTQADKTKASNDLNSCFGQSGMFTNRSIGRSYNFNKLSNLEPDTFINTMNGCIDGVKISLGRKVADNLLDEKLKEMEGLAPELQIQLKKDGMEKGFDRCVNIQQEKISAALAEYNRIKKINLAKAKGKTPEIPDVQIPIFNPGACAKFVILETVSGASIELIKSEIGLEEFAKLVEADGGKTKFMKCFEDEKVRLRTELSTSMDKELGMDSSEIAIREKARSVAADVNGSRCLKDALIWAIEKGSAPMITKMLAANPEYSDIKFDEKGKQLVSSKLVACFKEELKPMNEILVVASSFDKIKDKCGANMLKDREIQDVLIIPIIEMSLTKGGLTKEESKKIIGILVKDLNEDIKDEETIDGVLAKLSAFKGPAVIKVIDFVLESKIYEMVEGTEEEKQAEVAKIKALLEKELFTGPYNLRVRLKWAAESGDETWLAETLSELKEKAALVIAPVLIEKEGQKLLESGVLQTQKQVDELKVVALKNLKTCIEETKEFANEDVDILEICITETKVKSTSFVVSSILSEKLDEESIRKYLSDAEIEEVKKAVLAGDFEDEARRVFSIKDKDKAEVEMRVFTLSVKANASGQVANTLIPKVVDELLPTPKSLQGADRTQFSQKRERIKIDSKANLDACLAGVKVRGAGIIRSTYKKENQVEPDELLNNCLNKARLFATNSILPIKLEEALRFITSKDKLNKEQVDAAKKNFNSCSSTINTKIELDDYSDKLDACTFTTLFSFAEDSIGYVRELGPDLLKERPETLPQWKACVEKVKGHSIKYLKERRIDTSKLEQIDKKKTHEFYTEAIGASKKLPIGTAQIDMKWLLHELNSCAMSDLAVNVLKEFRDRVTTSKELNLSTRQIILTNELVQTFENILDVKQPNGEPIRVVLQLTKADRAKAQNETLSSTSNPDSSGVDTGVLHKLRQQVESVFDYLQLGADYDFEGLRKGLKELEKEVIARAKANGGILSLEEISEIFVNSKLSTTMIQAIVSQQVKEMVPAALKEQGADTAVTYHLASKQMIGRLFSERHAEGGKVIKDIKQNYLLPLLNGKLEDTGLPKKMMTDAKMVLANDTGLGGFAEVLFQPIIQKKLDDQRAVVENPWYLGLPIVYAVVKEGVQRKDFYWGNRHSTNGDRLRFQKSGKKAVKYFSNNLLKPILMGQDLSDSTKEAREEKLAEYIESAMHENSWP